jgi:hypothetical protein
MSQGIAPEPSVYVGQIRREPPQNGTQVTPRFSAKGEAAISCYAEAIEVI